MLSCEYIAGCILGLALVLLWTVSAGAQQLALEGLVLDNVGERIQLRFGVQAKDVDALEQILEKGGQLQMQCDIRLRRRRGWWPDSTVVEKRRRYHLKTHPLTQTYRLINQHTNSTARDDSLQDLMHRQWKEIILDLGAWKMLDAGADYILELTLQFTRPNVPQWLKTTLFFWSWDVVTSQTFRMHFTY
ncbi:DUF4390 domain-containing protein [Desulfovermiculus halophilus]|jgi:hypothetical protein|uniref:DUF4390 domain-containing protein n=1 Tax=Desulfovermiculus halophilus TaxID=339722 RepID=UPI000484AFE0|nr:DUF4390 domain-containing protein [Desulfovermiculus halophilus]